MEDELLRAAFDRNTEAFERNSEAFQRNSAALDRFEGVTERFERRDDDQRAFMHEMMLRFEKLGNQVVGAIADARDEFRRVGGELRAELRAERAEWRQELREFSEEMRAQRQALFRILDRLPPADGNGATA
jgi:hypothetical protein